MTEALRRLLDAAGQGSKEAPTCRLFTILFYHLSR